MLSFIKKLFSGEEKNQDKKFTLQELEEWLDSNEKEKQRTLALRIAEFEHEFNEIKGGLDHQLLELQKATLQNTSIPAKAFHFMEGNRESYIRFMKQFLLAVSKLPTDAGSIEKYCANFTDHLNHFADVSQRNYFVLQNFFANTLKDIGQLIKSLEGQVKRLLDEYEFSKIVQIQDIKKKIEEFRNTSNHKKNLEAEILTLEQDSKKSSERISEANEALRLIEQGNEWEHLKNIENDLVLVNEKKKSEEQKISLLFSPLEKALKKYSKEAFDNQKLIEKYGENPLEALQNDDQLKIVPIIEKLKSSLLKNGLGLDEKRIQKANIAIESLTKETLLSRQQTLKSLMQKIVQLENKISSSTIKEKHELQLKALNVAIGDEERIQQSLELMQKKKGEIDEKKMLQELEHTIIQKLKVHIIIVDRE